MLVRETVLCFLILTIAANVSTGRPVHRRHPRHRQQRSHYHDHEEEEGPIEDETHDNLQLIRDIIQMVGFNLTFGRDGLKIHLGSRSNSPFPHTEAKSLNYRSSANNADPKNQVNLIKGSTGKDPTILISGRPYLLIPMPDNYGLIPMPGHKRVETSETKGTRDSKTPLFGQPVTASTTTTDKSNFVFPTLLTPNPVTDSFRDFEVDAATINQ